jgi:hypothetical protein
MIVALYGMAMVIWLGTCTVISWARVLFVALRQAFVSDKKNDGEIDKGRSLWGHIRTIHLSDNYVGMSIALE